MAAAITEKRKFSTGGLYDTESPMMPSPEPGERDDDAALTTDRKSIQTAWMELESRDYAQALAALEQMVTDCGGYIESRSEQGRQPIQQPL